MIIGVLEERKVGEHTVGVTPNTVVVLVRKSTSTGCLIPS